MKEINSKYMLVLEKRPFDDMPINIGLLDIGNKINYTDIKDIDAFTKAFTKEEILESVKKANILTQDYLNGELVVVEITENNSKYLHKYKSLTSEVINGFDLLTFIYSNISNKNLMNSIVVKYSNLMNDDESSRLLKECVTDGNIRDFIRIIYMMPYLKNRELCIYIIDKLLIKESNLIRKKAA